MSNVTLLRPKHIKDFYKKPSRRQWNAHLDQGWNGPDGSSFSTDTIFGVRIGRSHPSYNYFVLPANKHDMHYRIGRLFRLGPEFRKAADQIFRDECISVVMQGCRPVWKPLVKPRCWIRYLVLRISAKFAFTSKAKTLKEKWGPED